MVTRGQSVVEVLVALGIFVLIVSAITFLLLDAYSANRQGAERTQAVFLAQEGMEAVKSMKAQRFGNLALGDHGISSASGRWQFSATSDTTGKYTRTVGVAVANRDGSGAITEVGGTPDLDTRQVTTTVRWPFSPVREGVVDFVSFFTNWRGRKVIQTTQADFDAGTKTNVRSTNASGGEVQLDLVSSGTYGNEFRVDSLGNVPLTQSTTLLSMRFTAQNSGSIDNVRVYVESAQNSPVYRFGLQANVAGQPSGTFLASATGRPTAAGWFTLTFATPTTLTAGSTYHLVVQYESGTISNSRRIRILTSNPRNGLYPSTQAADPNANVLQFTQAFGEWTPMGRQPIYSLGSVGGSLEGNPYSATTEQTIAAATFAGETFIVSGGDKAVGSVSVYVRKNTSQTPADDLRFVLEDVTGGTIVSQGVLVARGSASTTYAYQTFTFPSNLTLTDGRTYRLSLRSPGSVASRSYGVRRIENVGGVTYDTMNYAGAANRWTLSTNSGASWTDNASADVGGYRFSILTGFAAAGEFVSSNIDTGNASTAYNYLGWTADVPAGSTLRFQVRTANNQGNLTSASWVGPDGTAAMFFTVSGESITPDPAASGTRWLQYRALFTSNGIVTPVVEDVTVDYE